jgi:hypothetical protein
LQERYGYTKEEAQDEWNKFVNKNGNRVDDAKADLDAAKVDAKAAANHVRDAANR